ncbi:hypothetical protein ACC690_39745, partial [Rhizobium johnstonii]|uniref:hypothetical protein n=1 Tax=Rhizobium johnstonii TaxID=3019933 RepID=UPI003F9A2D10
TTYPVSKFSGNDSAQQHTEQGDGGSPSDHARSQAPTGFTEQRRRDCAVNERVRSPNIIIALCGLLILFDGYDLIVYG